MAVFEGKKSTNDIINHGRISDDGVVASYVPPRYLFDSSNKVFEAKKKKTRTARFIRCDYLVGTYCSFSFVGWTDRPTDQHFYVIYELSLTVSRSMSNFVVIGA